MKDEANTTTCEFKKTNTIQQNPDEACRLYVKRKRMAKINVIVPFVYFRGLSLDYLLVNIGIKMSRMFWDLDVPCSLDIFSAK